ncbi:peptide ABC transporter permease [Synergistales bacterium]|nr:peptide ABC transporter permease [Synergistales bacterium]
MAKTIEVNRLYAGNIHRKGQLSEIWKRLKKNRLAVAGMYFVILLLLVAVFANYIAPYPYDKANMVERLQYPSLKHWMGTDNFGRDLFSRLIVGTRVSLMVAAFAVTISLFFGSILGYTAAYIGGIYETFVMRIMDAFLSIPSIILAIAIAVSLGFGVTSTAIAIGFSNIPVFARVSRAAVLTIKDNEFIEAARSNGAGNARILIRHIVPNSLAPILVQISLSLANSILVISSLSFVGCGVQPPTPEWGSILSVGREYIGDFYPFLVFPGIFISVTLISFNLFSDGLRDALDPRLK